MLSVVCWKWQPPAGYRSKFEANHVNTLAAMVQRHYRQPHRFICVTDDPVGLDAGIEVIPLWDTYAEIPNPSGKGNPSCYRRLKAFAAGAEEMFGKRFVSVDLDCVITGNMVPVWNRPEDFVIWGDTNPRNTYNGSMFLMTAGARRRVWDEFDPIRSPRAAYENRNFGSDQGWISYILGPGETRWTSSSGVYSYRNQIVMPPLRGKLPTDARIVFFHGQIDPWSPEAQRHAWVREHWR